MQDQFPPSPKPKEIQHVVMDADDTIWEVMPWGISSMATPIGHTDKDILPVEVNIDELVLIPEFWSPMGPTGSVSLDPTLRDTLDKLEKKGISVSIASRNDKDKIMQYLEAFGLTDKFVDVEASWIEPKSHMVKKIAKRQKIDTNKMLFIDDEYLNAMDVSSQTDATSLLIGYNIGKIADILEFIK